MPFQADEAVGVPRLRVGDAAPLLGALLAADVPPYLVRLHVLDGDTLYQLSEQPLTAAADLDQQPQDGPPSMP